MLINKIAVRPYMKLDESFSGYILRLTYENGFKDVTAFLKYGGINTSSTASFDKSVRTNKNIILDFLEIALNRNRESIDIGITYSDVIDFNRSIKNLHLDFLRICPHCIKEKKYIKETWLLAPVAHCEIHKCLLIESCPHCNSKLNFKSDIFEHCNNCGFQWQDYNSSDADFSNLEYQILNILNGNNQNNLLVGGICEAICSIARPLDFIHPIVHTISHCENYSLLVKTAYNFFNTPDLLDRWNDISSIEKPYLINLRNDLVNFQLFNLKNKLKKIQFCINIKPTPSDDNYLDLIKLENVSFAKHARQNICSHVDDLRHQVTFKEIATILNIKSSEVSHLTGKHRLKPLNTSSIIRDQIYDVRDLFQLINNYTIESNIIFEDYIEIHCKEKMFFRYLTTFSSLIGSIFDQSVSAYIKTNNCEFSVLIKKTDLTKWLLNKVSEACKQPVAFSNARKLLRCSDLVLQEYIDSQQLKLYKTTNHRSNQMLDGTMLHDLFISLDLPVR